MNLKLILLNFSMILIVSAKTFCQDVIFRDGIYIETFENINLNNNRFTDDNSIYTTGTKFYFKYSHINPSGEQYMIRNFINDSLGEKAWEFSKLENKKNVIKLIMHVEHGREPMIFTDTSYSQTVIKYDYLLADSTIEFNEYTGVVENNMNLWMHPPRTKYFQILELNPFPFVMYPLEINNSWKWSLEIGEFWGDKRWKIWSGSINISYDYKITAQKVIQTKMGKLDCYVIEGVAKSKIGRTKLISYFNQQYGFVKLDYTNIDGSKTILELEKVE